MTMPTHPVLSTLVELHQELKKGRGEVLVWRGEDGTEAIVFGQRIFAALPEGPVRGTSADVLRRTRGGLRSLGRIVRKLVGRVGSVAPARCIDTGDASSRATAEEVSAVLELVRRVMGREEAAHGASCARQLEARFALDPPAVSTLRALLADLRLYVAHADEATNDAISILRARIAVGARRPRAPAQDAAQTSVTPRRRRSK